MPRPNRLGAILDPAAGLKVFILIEMLFGKGLTQVSSLDRFLHPKKIRYLLHHASHLWAVL
ncbi:hypothetical protein CCP3SC1AL1_670020 [Gammaproteobacteria bacterium]